MAGLLWHISWAKSVALTPQSFLCSGSALAASNITQRGASPPQAASKSGDSPMESSVPASARESRSALTMPKRQALSWPHLSSCSWASAFERTLPAALTAMRSGVWPITSRPFTSASESINNRTMETACATRSPSGSVRAAAWMGPAPSASRGLVDRAPCARAIRTTFMLSSRAAFKSSLAKKSQASSISSSSESMLWTWAFLAERWAFPSSVIPACTTSMTSSSSCSVAKLKTLALSGIGSCRSDSNKAEEEWLQAKSNARRPESDFNLKSAPKSRRSWQSGTEPEHAASMSGVSRAM
mmetsp:Transcript_47377/g.119392  ORF Transcript_47377/g.119392 Transcript_47377/m.119392 type:complete len:299 (+) Transcript_47377:1172-2068(+)